MNSMRYGKLRRARFITVKNSKLFYPHVSIDEERGEHHDCP